MVERRAKELKFDALLMGHANKTNALRSLCESHHIELENIAYMGDDLNDFRGSISCRDYQWHHKMRHLR